MKNIINPKLIDYTKQPMFCGEDLSIQRYDRFRYPIFHKNFKDQLGMFWRPEEVSLQKDRSDFGSMIDVRERIFTLNLKYQSLLDSVQSRAIPFLMEHVTIPELEAAMSVWASFETLHSYAYTYIIKNVYADPGAVFDSIMDDGFIMERAASTTRDYENLMNGSGNLRQNIFRTLISVYILEGIRFYVSFACTYAFAENKQMEGNAKIISFINRDENLHLAISQNIINFMRKNEDEGFSDVYDDHREWMNNQFASATKEEIAWAEYLFQDGALLGLNAELLTQYMKWLTNKRMKAIGLDPIFDNQKNPLGWITNWTDSKRVQVAPQESEIETYKVGALKSDISDGEFDDFML